MSVFNNVLSAGLAGLVLIGGSVRVASAAQPAVTQAAASVDDGALKSQIKAGLKKSSTLAPRDIDVDVEQGVATLTGTVRTESEKARAGVVAKVKGVIRVDNKIEVDPKIDQSKIDTAGQKTKAGVGKAVDATVTAAQKTKEAVQKGVGKGEQGVGKAADKTSDAVGKAGDKLNDGSITDAGQSWLLRREALAGHGNRRRHERPCGHPQRDGPLERGQVPSGGDRRQYRRCDARRQSTRHHSAVAKPARRQPTLRMPLRAASTLPSSGYGVEWRRTHRPMSVVT